METPSSSDESEALPRLLFGRHQGYDLRVQWLTKGLLALAQTEQASARARLFAFPDATDRFGIGPGMVASLRYWLRASGLMQELPAGKHGRVLPALTPLGAILAQHDPSLERSGSRWLLHAHLARNLVQAPTFTWFFQCFVGSAPFTKEECLDALCAWAIRQAPQQQSTATLLRRDLECLLRLYAHQPHDSSPERALLSSPLRPLGLLRVVQARASLGHATQEERPCYLLCPPQPGDIPPLIVLALLLEQSTTDQQISLQHLLYRQQQIGRTCCVKLGTLVDALRCLHALVPDWSPHPTWLNGEEKGLELPRLPVEQVLLSYYQQPS